LIAGLAFARLFYLEMGIWPELKCFLAGRYDQWPGINSTWPVNVRLAGTLEKRLTPGFK
jgi:hypothetical protein